MRKEKQMKNILGLQTYGKVNFLKRNLLEVKDRFRVNSFVENYLNEQSIFCYVPRLNKPRFIFSIVLAIIFIALPFVTLLSVPIILWGIN